MLRVNIVELASVCVCVCVGGGGVNKFDENTSTALKTNKTFSIINEFYLNYHKKNKNKYLTFTF